MQVKDNISCDGWNQDLLFKLKLYLISVIAFIVICYCIALEI